MNEVRPKKKRIAVVILGTVHRDPAPIVMAVKLMRQLTKLGLKTFYCSELGDDQTLDEKTQRDQQCANQHDDYLKIPPISKHLRKPDKHHAKPYFNLSDGILIKNELQDTPFSVEAKKALACAVEQILRFNYFKEQVRLNQYLQESKIPYQGLEQPDHVHTKVVLSIHDGTLSGPELEQLRIDHMTKTSFKTVFPSAVDGTVILCEVGVLHAQRLAANILSQLEQEKELYELMVIPLHCSSAYASDNWQYLLDEIQIMRENDSPEIQAIYKTLPDRMISLAETKNGNDFESEEFCKAFQEAAMFVKPPRMYFIPTTDKELITRQNGKVLQAKNGGLYASFRSCDLNAERRKTLGIDRRLLTLDENGPEKLELLRSRKEFIVIEETCIPHKFLVTFPPSELNFVTKVSSKNWRELLAVNTVQPELKGKGLK